MVTLPAPVGFVPSERQQVIVEVTLALGETVCFASHRKTLFKVIKSVDGFSTLRRITP